MSIPPNCRHPYGVDRLKLPFRIRRGFAENVKIAVPITNLYKGTWEVEVGGLYVTAGPVTGFRYDAETAAREEFEHKQTQLSKVEEAKKKAEAEKEGKQEEKGFFGGVVESLVAHILKVVQIRVGNVHVQYEDGHSHPQHPFVCGITVEGLFLQSTDGQWKVGGRSGSDSLVFKLAELENLSVYWNTDASLTATLGQQEWEESMQRLVARGSTRPHGISYLFGPVSASARIMFNTKAGQILTIPLVKVELGVEQVDISLDKLQFDGILSLLDSLDRMSTQKKFLQFRPYTSLTQLQGRDKLEWFRYAARSVHSLIHKRRLVWSWSYIKQVRNDAKSYQSKYKEKLLTTKPPSQLLEELKELETRMSIFNITIARTQAESEVERSRLLEAESRSTSWASSLLGWVWSSSDTPKETATQPHIPTDAEIEAEKDKLYASIGYSEGSVKGKFPQEYVAYRLDFSLKQIAVHLRDDQTELLSLAVQKAAVQFEGRPSAGGIKIDATVDSLNASGCFHGDTLPQALVSTNESAMKENEPLLSLTFELNPFDPEQEVKVDQKIILNLLPVQVVYDGDTVDGVIKMFKVPPHVQLHRLSALALSKLADIQTQTRAGLEHALNVRKVMDIRVNLAAPYLVVPFGGKLSNGVDVLVVDLGSLSIHSDWSHLLASERDIREATADELEESFYDHFYLKLKDTQIIMASKDDNWETVRRSMTESTMHLLPPVLLNLTLKKSLVFNDPHRPNIIVSGDLPELKLLLSEDKVVRTVKLLRSLPLPPPSLKRDQPMSSDTSVEFSEVVDDVLKELTVGEPDDETASDLAAKALVAQSRHSSANVSANILDEGSSGEDSSDEYLTASEGEGTFTPPLLTGLGVSSSKLHREVNEDEELPLPSVKGDMDQSPEQLTAIVQVKVDLSIDKAVLQLAVCGSHGDESPRLSVEVLSLQACVCKRTFDLNVEVSTGKAIVVDHFVQDLQHNTLIQSEQERMLTVRYAQVDRGHPGFSSQMHSTLKSIVADVSGITVQVVRESLADLLRVAKRLGEALSSPNAGTSQSEDALLPIVRSASRLTTGGDQASETAQVEDDSAVVDLRVNASFGGLGLSLRNDGCEVMLAQVQDLSCKVALTKQMIQVTASLRDLYVADRTSSVLFEDIIRKVNPTDTFVTVKFTMFKYPDDQAKYKATSSPDIAINVALKQLRAIVRFRFLKALQVFASQLVVDRRMLDSAKEAASTAAARTARAIQEAGEAESYESTATRIQLDIAVQAPLIAVLLEEGSKAALVGDLGHLTIKNSFQSVEDGSGAAVITKRGIPAVVDVMEVAIESVKLSRTNRFDLESSSLSEEFVICRPSEFHGQVRRNLSPWHQEVPSLEVFAEMGDVAVCVCPEDVRAVKTLTDSATMELGGQAARTEEEEGEKEEAEAEDIQHETEEKCPPPPTPSPGTSTVVVHANVQSASLTLKSELTSIAEIAVNGLHSDVHVGRGVTKVTASLQGAKVLDLLGDPRYQTIAAFTDNSTDRKAINVQLSLFSGGTEGEKQHDMSKCDIAVSGRMSGVKVVFVNLFIKRLQNFVQKLSSAVIDRAREFSAKQATKAAEELQQASSSSKRISISLLLGTPIIQLPLTSKSTESFLLQLGQLHVQNSFHVIGEPAPGTDPLPVYDQMDVKLENISLYRQIQAQGSEEVAQRCLLKPFNLVAVVKRSLSPWYSGKELAEKVDVDLCIGETQLGVADDDIVKVLELLHGNLSETLVEQEKKKLHHLEGPAADPLYKEEEEEEEVVVEEDDDDDEQLNEITEIQESQTGGSRGSQIRVAARVAGLSVIVHRSGGDMVLDDQLSWEHNHDRQLASFSLQHMDLLLEMISSAELKALLLLGDCIMADLRSNRCSSIAEIIQKCPMTANQPLLKVDYDRSQPGPYQTAQRIDIVVQRMQVLLDMEFLFTLKDFADEILSSSSYIAKRAPPKADTLPSDTHTPPKGDTLPSNRSRQTVKRTVTDSSSKVHVEFKVQHPYIALLAKTGSGNEDALLLKGDIGGILSMTEEGGSHDNQGSIRLLTVLTDLSMYGTTTSQLQSPLHSQSILQPCSFTLAYSAPSSTDKDLLILLESTSSVDFVLSPADIRVLLGVARAAQRPKLDSGSDVFDSASDLGILESIDDTKWYLVKEEEPSLMEKVVEIAGLVTSTKIKREEVKVAVPKITLTLEHDFDGGDRGSAFKLLVTDLSSNVENWSSDIRGSASLALQAAFFNKRFDVWEYLVEPLELENREFKFWTMSAEINPLQAQQDMEGSSLAPKTLVKVSANEALQLTLTRSSIGKILNLMDEYTRPVQSQVVNAKVQSQVKDSRPLIVIQNRLGERFAVTIKPMEKLEHVDGSKQVQLKNEAEERFVSTATSSEEPSGGLLKQVAQRLVLEVTISAFNKTVVIISGCNTTYYPLKLSQSNTRQPFGFVVEVESTLNNTTLVKFRSPVQVVNQLEEPCLVAMAADHRLAPKDINRALSLEAGEKYCLPMDLAHAGHVFVKLKNKSVEFSDNYVKWNKSEKETLRCPRIDPEANDHYVRVSIVEEVYSRGTALMDMTERAHHIFALHYPIVLQNYLPHKLKISSKCLPTETIRRGQSINITTCALMSESHTFLAIGRTPKLDFTVTVHMDGAEWQGEMTVEGREDKADHFAVQHDKMEKTLAVHKDDRGSWRLSVYAPYWIINKTHLTLEYSVPSSLSYHRSSDDHVVQRGEDPDEDQPSIALLKLSSDLFKSSTNLRVRVQVSKSEDKKCPWSKDFSLDTVGYAGVIRIEHRSTAYHFGVMVQLSSHQLTKIITLSPFFLLENQTKHIVNYFEPAVDKDACYPHVLKPKAVVPFHPAANSTSLQISLGQEDQVSMPFNFMQPGSLLVRTKGKTSAVCMNVKATDHATLVSFAPYFVGSAPFLVVNNTKGLTLKVEQIRDSGTSIPRHVHTVLPGHTYLYTWDNPLGKKGLLCWIMGPGGKEMRKFNVKPQDANGKFKLPKSYKNWLSLVNTVETMSMVGGSRRSGSAMPTRMSSTAYGAESELSESGSEAPSVGKQDVDGVAALQADQWFQYAGEAGDSSGSEEDSDFEGTEETDSGSTPQPKRTASTSQRVKKFFSFRRSGADPDKESTFARMKGRWVSFMDNIQRVLLFTLHKDEIRKALRGQSVERPHLECTLSLRFAGLSLVDDVRGQEVTYIGLMPCPVVWEWEKRPGYWRVLKMDEVARLEKAFQEYTAALDKVQPDKELIDQLKTQTIDLQGADWTVQFEAPVQMTSLKQGETHRLRRSAFPGVFFKYTYSPSQTTVRARVFNVQVDNQLPNAMFPQVLYSIPPPPSIASSLEPKPLVEASVIMRNAQDSQAKEFKLIQVLLQKIGVELELGFILAISRLLSDRKKRSTESEDLESDLVQLKQPLHESLLPALVAAQKAYFDTIHLSPVHIILSLSLTQTLSSKEEMQEDSLSVFSGLDPLSNIKSIMQSLGTFIVDIKQAELKLNYFDASQVVLTSPELVQLVKQHYTQQVLLQLYKVVFNLNVIGNPVGLLGGLASGVTNLFYEPFQGIMVGPEEFVEALGIGVHSALGGTVGGALGVFGALTGKLGDAVALGSMAEGEREHRRVEQRQGHLGYGVGGLLKGFGGAITNIVIQPVKGARAEGVVGFFKGAGRGVLGIVLRPVGGVLDLTSIAVDRLRKVTKINDYEIVQIRLPRHIAADRIVRPYSHFTASGKAFFMELEPSASHDLYYITHFPLKVDPVSAFMVTNKYAVLFSQSGVLDILKKWDRDETVDYDKMNRLAVREGNTLQVKVKKDFALFSRKEETIQVVFPSPDQAQEAAAALNKAYDNFVLMKSHM